MSPRSLAHWIAATSATLAVVFSVPAFADPLPPGAKVTKDIPYVPDGHERQKLDLYLPAGGINRPLIVWVHGGGWEGGNKDGCPALGMLNKGFAVASIGYRLSQHAIFPAQIEDCKSAVRWLRAHAAENGIDPSRIGAWGASAGGHLVALLGTTGETHVFDHGENLDQSSGVQCVLDWFGPADFLHWGGLAAPRIDDPKSPICRLIGGPVSAHDEAAKSASPIYFVSKDSAPFLIMHGDQDKLVPLQQSESLNAALKKAGVESTLDIIAGAGHGSPAFVTGERLAEMANFFISHLGPGSKTTR